MINIDKLTEIIIGCAFKVHNTLGEGFVEKVYENALKYELEKHGLKVKQQFIIVVYYENIIVGSYKADLFVEDEIIIELKAIQNLVKADEVKIVNYLTATKKDIGLLINFGPSVIVKRKYRTYKKKSCKSC